MDSGYTNNAVSYSDNGDGTIPDRNTGLTWQLQILQFWAPTPSECVATVQLLIVLGQNWNYYYVGRVRQCRNPAKKNIPQFIRKAGLRLTTNPAYKPICIFYTTVGSAFVQLVMVSGLEFKISQNNS